VTPRRIASSLLRPLFFCLTLTSVSAQMPALRGAPMLKCSGLPCVDVTLATGKHLRMLVDTGNVNSVLDTAVAQQLGLVVSPISGSDGKPLAGYGRALLPGVKVGEGTLGDLKVLVMDLAAYIKRDRMPAADGALAYTAFKNRILQLDYVKRQVQFSDVVTQETPCIGNCGALTLPTFGKKGPPIVVATGFSVNDQPITAQVDTLFTGTLLIYPTSVEKLGLGEVAMTQKKQFFPYTDDGVDMLEATAKAEAFGKKVLAQNAPLYFAGPTVHLPDGMFDATVGHALFEHSILTLDFHDMKMWME
jgi:Aspartyl protease